VTELIRVEIGDGTGDLPAAVATIWLNRPPMDALNRQLQE
jgi:hypothetical protein